MQFDPKHQIWKVNEDDPKFLARHRSLAYCVVERLDDEHGIIIGRARHIIAAVPCTFDSADEPTGLVQPVHLQRAAKAVKKIQAWIRLEDNSVRTLDGVYERWVNAGDETLKPDNNWRDYLRPWWFSLDPAADWISLDPKQYKRMLEAMDMPRLFFWRAANQDVMLYAASYGPGGWPAAPWAMVRAHQAPAVFHSLRVQNEVINDLAQ